MDKMYSIQGIIFDFDGLIIDSETPIFQAWQKLYQVYGQSLKMEDWVDVIGKSPEDHDPLQALLDSAGDEIDEANARQRVSRWERANVEGQEPLPGVEEVIAAARLADLKLGIASSSSTRWVHAHLRRLGLYDYFDVICCADHVEQAKPHPALYRMAVEKLALEPEQVIVLEDSPNGVLAAKRAGLYCVAVPNRMTRGLSFQHGEHQPDMMLESLTDLPLEDFLD